jgi:tetratricopeptide (TPR) repeat protein
VIPASPILVVVLAMLLPVAALSGWIIGRRNSERSRRAGVSELSSSYFRGLNYLLNEQPDKAIEVFLKLAEFNRDTVETHLALGNLFRRRGEVDRAIRVHQHLIARPNLSDQEKTIALLELGEDYMRAGLLDRAETLFTDLIAMDAQVPSALKHLISIYQHEKDWNKAIDHARAAAAMNRKAGDRAVLCWRNLHAHRRTTPRRMPISSTPSKASPNACAPTSSSVIWKCSRDASRRPPRHSNALRRSMWISYRKCWRRYSIATRACN